MCPDAILYLARYDIFPPVPLSPADKTKTIEAFFSKTGPTYDSVVHYFTLGIDRLWKKRMEAALPPHPRRILDLACGTGILTLAIARAYPQCHVVGVDISDGYLGIAKAKARGIDNVVFIRQRAEDFVSELPFDAVCASYLPKYAVLDRLIPSIASMLSPGGRVILHDFTYPTDLFLKWLFEGYMKLIGPIGGWCYPEWKEVLRDLPGVIRETTWVSETVEAMDRAGLDDIYVRSLTLQGAALITAERKREPNPSRYFKGE
jgi:demethylmenaquinone methyltransferase/2-methoxy-6-polyprenyl-1,4-benzoquinol methylase